MLQRRVVGVSGKNTLQVELRPLLVSITEKPMETQPRSTRVQATTEMISDADTSTSDTRSNDNFLSNLPSSKFDSGIGAVIPKEQNNKKKKITIRTATTEKTKANQM